MKKKYIFITNIPTPYRNYFYNILNSYGLNFEVLYLRHIEYGRSWLIKKSLMNYKNYIDNGFYRALGNYHLHINPKIIWRVIKNPDAELIFGISWNDLDLLILVSLRRFGIIKNRFYFWTEANYLTIGSQRDNILKIILRKYVYHCSSDCVQIISGKMTELTLRKWGVRSPNKVRLSNTIDESIFLGSPKSRPHNRKIVFCMPVRLIESIKGVLNFFNAIGIDNIKKSIFYVAGDGPDYSLIKDYIIYNNLQENIILLGFLNPESMARLYAKSDVFLLPSFSDPCPLSVVEALSMSLPLLISSRCGNHYEAVRVGNNGYKFDPLNPDEIKSSYEKIMSRSHDFEDMGEISRTIYEQEYKLSKVLEVLLLDLESID